MAKSYEVFQIPTEDYLEIPEDGYRSAESMREIGEIAGVASGFVKLKERELKELDKKQAQPKKLENLILFGQAVLRGQEVV